MGTSEKRVAKVLGVIDPKRAENFLLDLANRYPVNELLAGIVRQRHPENSLIVGPAQRLRKFYPEMAEPFGDQFRIWVDAIYWTQIFLKRAWESSDDRRRQWFLYEMRSQYRNEVSRARLAGVKTEHVILSELPGGGAHLQFIDRSLIEPPEITPFEAAAVYFQSRIGPRAKRCANPDCNTPYFIAPPAKARKYCGTECSTSADRDNKRKWWHDNKRGTK